MIAIIDTNLIINHMMDAERQNIKQIKKELKATGREDLIKEVTENIKNHFQAGIEKVKECKTDEDLVNLIKLAFVNFTVLQLDMKAITNILHSNGINLQDLIKAPQQTIPKA